MTRSLPIYGQTARSCSNLSSCCCCCCRSIRAETEEEKDRLVASINYLPRIYGVLALMGGALPGKASWTKVQGGMSHTADLSPRGGGQEGQEDALAHVKPGEGTWHAAWHLHDPGSDGRGACPWWLLVRRAVQLRALLAASLAPLMHGTDDEMEQLKQVRTTRPRPTTAGPVHRPHRLPVFLPVMMTTTRRAWVCPRRRRSSGPRLARPPPT